MVLILLWNNGYKYNEPWTTDSLWICILCDAYNALHNTVIVATSLLLEEPKGAEGYYNYKLSLWLPYMQLTHFVGLLDIEGSKAFLVEEGKAKIIVFVLSCHICNRV